MRQRRRERRKVHLFVGLLVSFAGPALALPGYGLPDEGGNLPYLKMDMTGDPEEGASLLNEALKLDAVLAYAQEHNPAIRAAQSRLVAAQERPAQVSALDDPTFTYEGFNLPENFDLTRTDNNILKLSQKLPFPGKRRLRGDLATHEAAIAREELRMAEVTTRAEVKKAYYDLWQVH